MARGPELARISELVENLPRRTGGVLLISGDTGLGKSRLLREAAERAQARRVTVLAVDCGTPRQRLPYTPWVEILRNHVGSAPRSRVYRLSQRHREVLFRLAPELRNRVWLYDPATEASESPPLPFLEQSARLFADLPDGQPTLITLDNLDEADVGSLELLDCVTREIRGHSLGIVGTFRERHNEEDRPSQEILARVASEPGCQSLRLMPLDREQLGELARASLGGGPVPAGARDALFERTKGNPLFALEVLRWLAEQGRLHATPTGWAVLDPSDVDVPPAMEKAIRSRWGLIPEENRVPSPPPPRLAVLPLSNISPDPSDAYVAEGLTEELIHALSGLRGLRVIARSSVAPYSSTPEARARIPTELHASAILEGSVRKAGDRLRVALQLTDAGSGEILWAEKVDREVRDLFSLQSEIGERVLAALDLELRSVHRGRRERPVVRPESYLAYLQGRAATASFYVDYQEVKGHFERAIALDPGNAAAYSGLADVIRSDQSEPRWEPTSRDLARRALEIDPALPEAHVTLGEVHLDDLDFSSAEGEYRTAISLNPSLSGAHMSYGWLLALLARPEEALLQFRLAEAADPLNVWAIYHAATLEVWAGKLDEARGQIEKLRTATEQFKKIGTDRIARHLYHHGRARIFRASSDRAGWAREIGNVVGLERDPRLRLIYRAWGTTVEGRPSDARALLREADAISEKALKTGSAEAYVFAELHDLDECFRRLNGMSRPWVWLHEYRLDPLFAHVRTDPRFDTLLRGLRLA